jgi:DNA-binding winged helix-turn-helix (wHTH) protein
MSTGDSLAPAASTLCHCFGDFELRPLERELLHCGRPTEIAARAFDLLVVLVGRAGRLVSRDDLLAAVWRRVIVEENNLEKQISALRRVIGAKAIRTVSGRGYCFVASVCTLERARGGARPGRFDSEVIAKYIVQVLDAAASFRELARSLNAVALPAHAEKCLDLFMSARAHGTFQAANALLQAAPAAAPAGAGETTSVVTPGCSTY